jgi:hypothetical protein
MIKPIHQQRIHPHGDAEPPRKPFPTSAMLTTRSAESAKSVTATANPNPRRLIHDVKPSARTLYENDS